MNVTDLPYLTNQVTTSDGKNIFYHYHIVKTQPADISTKPKATPVPTTDDKIKRIVGKALMALGAILLCAVLIGITIQTFGVTIPIGISLTSLLMPSVAIIVAGKQVEKKEISPVLSLNLPTGIPGVNIKV